MSDQHGDIFTEIDGLKDADETHEPCRTIVRLRTSYWHDKNGLHCRQSLSYLKRQCTGFQLIDDDCSMVGADHVMPRIVNLHECKDGIYDVVMINQKKDWETGHVEDWDYKLFPRIIPGINFNE
jgi:hypothetical protein